MKDYTGIANLSWAPEATAESLDAVRQYVEGHAGNAAGWYYAKKKSKARMSTALRTLATVLVLLGALVPALKATWPSRLAATPNGIDYGQLGYLLIAAGGVFFAFDRYGGFSSNWMRFMTTALAIDHALDEFRLEWAARASAALRGVEPNAAQLDQLLELCKSLSVKVRTLIEQETNAWVTESQSTLMELDKSLKAREQARAQAAKG